MRCSKRGRILCLAAVMCTGKDSTILSSYNNIQIFRILGVAVHSHTPSVAPWVVTNVNPVMLLASAPSPQDPDVGRAPVAQRCEAPPAGRSRRASRQTRREQAWPPKSRRRTWRRRAGRSQAAVDFSELVFDPAPGSVISVRMPIEASAGYRCGFVDSIN